MADKLKQISDALRANGQVPSVTTREFLRWFGAQRRGWVVVWRIRKELEASGIVTVPDFESTYIDSQITFALAKPKVAAKPKEKKDDPKSSVTDEPTTSDPETIRHDPTYRVSKLAAANQGVVSVKPDHTIEQVVTLMLERNFSQLPVMTSERELKGIISWGTIGAKVCLAEKRPFARDYMEKAHEVRHSDSMFDVIQTVVLNDCVVVKGEDGKYSGIITASDLSEQFRQLSEPFLILSEIENLLRMMIEGRFTPQELQSCANEGDASRNVSTVADLNFGEYIRLLENPDRWAKFGVAVDRSAFCKGLDEVRRIRNDVMHFDPDGVAPDDLERLRDYTRFLSRLRHLLS